MRLNRNELRKIQYDFNSFSNRLLQANFQDYTDVLGKFLNFINSTPIILDYITDCGQCEWELEKEVKEVQSSYGELIFSIGDTEEEETPVINLPSTTTSNTLNSEITANGKNYTTEAILEYPKLGINYPVLSEETEELLKISLCKYWGPNPNKVGNYCIVGHNYKSGKMFGKLSGAEIGDEVNLTDLNGDKVTYSVYNKYVVEPTDVSCTSQLTNNQKEITLITCTNYGQDRLVVKAREK